jgi:hypothetical protein
MCATRGRCSTSLRLPLGPTVRQSVRLYGCTHVLALDDHIQPTAAHSLLLCLTFYVVMRCDAKYHAIHDANTRGHDSLDSLQLSSIMFYYLSFCFILVDAM